MDTDAAALQAMGRVTGECLMVETWLHGARDLYHPDRRDPTHATPTAAGPQREARYEPPATRQ